MRTDSTQLDGSPSGADSSSEAQETNVVVVAGDIMRPDSPANRPRLLFVALYTITILAVLVLAYLVYQTLSLFLLLFIALLIGTAIEPLVNILRRGPLLGRSAGILIVYTGIFVAIGLIGWLTVPVVVQQVSELGGSLNKTVTSLRDSVKGIDNTFVRQEANALVNALSNFASQLSQPPSPSSDTQAVETAKSAALTAAEIFFALITIFVVAFYWLTERTLIKRSLMTWFSASRANRIRRVWDDIEVKVGGWVRGQLTLMVIVGLLSAIGYFVLGLRFWPALALFIFIAEAIPLVGPYIGTAPAVLVALTQNGNDGLLGMIGAGDMGGFTRAILVVIFAVVLQTIEGNVLVPRIMRNSVGISPFVVIVSILFGAALAGLAGALVAVPIAGSIQVIISDIKAAREGDEQLEAATSSAEATKAKEGELVVAYPKGGETGTGTVVK